MEVRSSTLEGMKTPETSPVTKGRSKKELYRIVSCERSVFCPFGVRETAGNLLLNDMGFEDQG
uniref:Uncharacterized protein n=1 Tax=Megaselia scalaris TaxID=36166 RepID=T1GR93_MEGSC